MKTSLRKLVATVSGLAIAAVLPMASMMASAEDASLDFVATEADGQIILSVNVAGMDGAFSETPTNAWNVLEYNIAYDAAEVTPVQQSDPDGAPIDFVTGEAVRTGAMIEVNLDTNPVLVGAISSDGQFRNGEVMTIAFKLKDGVAAEDVELTVNVSQFAKAVIVDNKPQSPVDLVKPGPYTVTVEGGEPTQPTESQPTESQPTETQPTETQPTESKPTESQSTESKPTDDTNTSDTDDTNTSDTDDTNTSDTDGTGTSDTDDTGVVTPSASGDDAQPTLPSVDGGDVTIPGGDSGSGAGTGESTVLFVVALVLMAGSAAALVVMKKKKVFSK